MNKIFRRAVSYALVCSLAGLPFTAQAGMIGTDEVTVQTATQAERAKVRGMPALRRAQGKRRLGDQRHRLLETNIAQLARQARLRVRDGGRREPQLAGKALRVDAVPFDQAQADQAEGGEEGFGGHFRSVVGPETLWRNRSNGWRELSR